MPKSYLRAVLLRRKLTGGPTLAILALLPDDVLMMIGMSQKQIHEVKKGWWAQPTETQRELLRNEQIDLARFIGCCRIRSQRVVEVDGRRVGWNGCIFRFCPFCSNLLASLFKERIDRVISTLYEVTKLPLTGHSDGPVQVIYSPRPEKLPRKLRRALKNRGSVSQVGSLALVTVAVSKQAGTKRMALLDEAVTTIKQRFQDPSQRPRFRKLDVMLIFSTAEDTFSADGVHHHYHFLVIFGRAIEPNSEQELALAIEFDTIFREQLKAELGDDWNDAWLLPPYKGQTTDYAYDDHGQPIFFRWLAKTASGLEPVTDKQYEYFARSSKKGRPELIIAKRDSDTAIECLDADGNRYFRLCPRSPIKGGVSVTVGAVAHYLGKGNGWNIARKLSYGCKKLGKRRGSLSPAQMIRLLSVIHTKDLGCFTATSTCGKQIVSANLVTWHEGDEDVVSTLVPLPSTVKFECDPEIAPLIGHMDGYIQAVRERRSKHDFRVPKIGGQAVDSYFPERTKRIKKAKGVKACLLSHSVAAARGEYTQILKGEKSLPAVSDKTLAVFLMLYEKEFKERLRIFAGIGALTRALKKASDSGDDLRCRRLMLKREKARAKKIRVKAEFDVLLRFLLEIRPDFFGTWDARRLESMKCPSVRNCKAALRRVSLLAKCDPKLIEVAEKIFELSQKLTKGRGASKLGKAA